MIAVIAGMARHSYDSTTRIGFPDVRWVCWTRRSWTERVIATVMYGTRATLSNKIVWRAQGEASSGPMSSPDNTKNASP